MHPALQGIFIIGFGVSACVGYFFASNLLLDKVLFPPRGPNAGRNINRANLIRPWLFLLPAMIVLTMYLAYPVFETLRLSLTERVPVPGGRGEMNYEWVGLDNYRQMASEQKFWEAMRNNMMWLIVVPAFSTAIGLLVAQLTDRLKWGSLAKSMIFMPMAISFVGAAVIFKLIYDARPVDQSQIGALNAVWLAFEGGIWSVLILRILPAILLVAFVIGVGWIALSLLRPVWERDKHKSGGTAGSILRIVVGIIALWLILTALPNIPALFTVQYDYGEPQQWLTIPFWNNFFLMAVLIWIETGFAMVILSAALRGVPEDTIEAAIIDGANPFQIFFKIKVPQIMGTILVVWTTITIKVLKVFDIVFAMTNGQWETQVLANYMFDKLFRANDWGVGSASAIVIMLLVTPILVWNVWNARKEMR
ncbi:carbohydrate ABC transporter permease [Celeribacter sp.]|uniref:carbohydrate ABC transporter permease n=1 Tax=Celeribacter sp. TaxID=1890673 RepID=UPI003A94727E